MRLAALWRAGGQLRLRLANGANLPAMMRAPAPRRPIVILQSDDWGRVGIPSLDVLDELRSLGFPVQRSRWDFYGLETVEDIERLAELLTQVRDSDGRPACLTANFVMANADLRRIRTGGWQEFASISIERGFPQPWQDDLVPAYKRAIAANVFYPGLHGFTHFNIAAMMKAFRDPGDLGKRARALAERDIPYLRSVTPEFNFALVFGDSAGEHMVADDEQALWIDHGARLFTTVFGSRPRTACLPGYRANAATYRLLRRAGFACVQIASGAEGFDGNGIVALARNVFFEPALEQRDQVDKAAREACAAAAAGLPVIVCSHSINYIARFSGHAAEGRRQLLSFLRALLVRLPGLRFVTDADFADAWNAGASDWFRPPTLAERLQRIQRYVLLTSMRWSAQHELRI